MSEVEAASGVAAPPATDGAAVTAFDKDGVECDSAEAEDVDLNALLLDAWHGRLPGLNEGIQAFAVAHDAALLAAWRKQPSPCCAAAALAGAVNALGCVRREDARALGPLDVLASMRCCLRAAAAAKVASFERKLGADLAPLLDAIAPAGGGNRAAMLARVAAEVEKRADACADAVRRRNESERGENAEAGLDEAPATTGGVPAAPTEAVAPVFCRLWELYEEEAARQRERRLKLGAADGAAACEGERPDDEEDDDDKEDDEDEDEPACDSVASAPPPRAATPRSADGAVDGASDGARQPPPSPVKSSKSRPSRKLTAARRAARPWAWRKDLGDIFHALEGVCKTLADRPSTAAFGNWGLVQAAAELRRWQDAEPPRDAGDDAVPDTVARLHPLLFGAASWRCEKRPPAAVSVSVFVGAPSKALSNKGRQAYVAARRDDSDAAIEAQWGRFKAAFCDPETVLVYHLKNHYALVFATREWLEVPGDSGAEARPRRVRQILTARKGQRPTVWIDWLEVRQTVMNWAGYKMLLVRKLDDETQADAFALMD
ncbi:hypothetical protein M885DRAFT_89804 [Pelagophyceae sp. CCMP2097]|nr:hypothetical protein M885DRAFT_89804 [Pelagophyceae sp. CCMP2097]